MWEDILLAVGDVVLDFWPGRNEPEDFFFADVLEVREENPLSWQKAALGASAAADPSGGRLVCL